MELERWLYLEKLEALRGSDFIKIITGVRRCGKSTILLQFRRRLIQEGVPEGEILYMNFESMRFDHVHSSDELNSIFRERVPEKGRFFVLLDELQRVKDWEKSVNGLMTDTEADIYITGSNAHLLSSELSTYLTGRSVTMEVLPLSFSEYKEMWGNGRDDETLLEEYIRYGGFPSISPDFNTLKRETALRDLYNSSVIEDVISRGDVRDIEDLRRIMDYLMINIGNPISIDNIAKELGINRRTVERYIGLMEQAFLIYRANRFDIVSTSLKPNPKYYSVDQGLRASSIEFTQGDEGRIVENLVYLELRRRGKAIKIGSWRSKEIDFVTRDLNGRVEYYQVCLGLFDKDISARELEPLRRIEDNNPKTVIVRYGSGSGYTSDGIRVVSLRDWLSDYWTGSITESEF